MRFLIFDPGKMLFFQLTINLPQKKIYKTLYAINAYMFQVYFVKISYT